MLHFDYLPTTHSPPAIAPQLAPPHCLRIYPDTTTDQNPQHDYAGEMDSNKRATINRRYPRAGAVS